MFHATHTLRTTALVNMGDVVGLAQTHYVLLGIIFRWQNPIFNLLGSELKVLTCFSQHKITNAHIRKNFKE
ncbi:hypothetical protein T10_4441 [Trichinella papuae]|uniref:Uncharacterized protein n=1 Tax=Trichinella papuae TaxID=268474 RepID=A0A0V1N1P3_9BILA|nr:hypothetical protein T10_2621 [Trichinella papuae]KRZ77678.1 hypothetical protein T10_4441 [Trichinella papuae]